jgi:putative aldouronate transport system substrate-binding protein
MKRKNVFFLILLAGLILSPLSAGGRGQRPSGTAGQSAAVSAPGQFPLTSSRAELKVLTMNDPWLKDFNSNSAAKWYEDHTGVRVSYSFVPYQGTLEALNLLLAGGEYPDIVMCESITPAVETSYGSQGIFIPLNDLISRYGHWMNEAFKRYPELPAALVHPDGNIYSLPTINEAFHTYYMNKA